MLRAQKVIPAPVELFSINFDLSPETAIEVGEARFGCEYSEYNKFEGSCFFKGSTLFKITQKIGKLSSVTFYCTSFDGCSFSDQEIIEALAAQKSLKFSGGCTITELGAEICVKYQDITMSRNRFRVRI